MAAIYKKELRQYFHSMIGFVFLAFFLAIVGIYTCGYNLMGGYGNFELTLGSITFLLVILIPLVTMRLVAEEKKQKTDQLLYTSPVSVEKIILGKYFAVLTLFAIVVGVLCLYPLLLRHYGTDVQLAPAYSALIGFFLLGSSYLAVGLFLSSLTESQAIAAVISFLTLLVSHLMESLSSLLPSGQLSQALLIAIAWIVLMWLFLRNVENWILPCVGLFAGEAAIWGLYLWKSSLFDNLAIKALKSLAMAGHFDDFTSGLVPLRGFVYYLGIDLIFLVLTILRIRRITRPVSGRARFRAGALGSVLAVVCVAAVVCANLGAAKLDWSKDFSSGKLYTLSSATKKMASSLTQDVTLYYMAGDSQVEEHIQKVLRQYKKLDHIRVKQKDPSIYTGFAKKYVGEDANQNDVIVVNDKTKEAKLVDADSMYYQDYSSDYTSSSQYLDVEGQVSSAIWNVTSGTKGVMYSLMGHQETELGDSVIQSLEKMGVENKSLSLITQGTIPKDCDILFINGPATDLTSEEKKEVLSYLKKGGKGIFLTQFTDQDTPNYDSILKYYGLKPIHGIVYESPGNYYYYYPDAIIPSTGVSEITNSIDGYIILPDTCAFEKGDSTTLRKGVTLTDLLTTTDDAYLKKEGAVDTYDKEKGDKDGPFSVGVYVCEEKDDSKTELVVYGAANALASGMTEESQFANAKLMTNAVSALFSPDTEKISVDKKNLSYSTVSLERLPQLLWAAGIVVVLPGVLLLTGFVIWFRRRRY